MDKITINYLRKVNFEPEFFIQCDPNIEYHPVEKVLIEILYWLRNKKKTLKWCQNRQVYPGPSGQKNKKGVWLPSPHEACDAEIFCYKKYSDK